MSHLKWRVATTLAEHIEHETRRWLSRLQLRMPKHPTNARPGSDEKIAVFQQRIADGEELWHPDDVTTFPRAPEKPMHGEPHVNVRQPSMVWRHPTDLFDWLNK